MDAETHDLVARLHASPLRCVVALAGAGSEALAWLLAVPGASRTLLEATVPYSSASLVDMLGHEPTSFASKDTAEKMANVAYDRALELQDDHFPVAGLGCAAAIRSDRPKRGPHRAHVCIRTGHGMVSFAIDMEKGLRERAEEERVVSLLALRSLAGAAGLEPFVSIGLAPSEHLEVDARPPVGNAPIDLLLSGLVEWIGVDVDGGMTCETGIEGAIMPGSFNPLHDGHIELRRAARMVLGCDVTFELSIANVDKPTLTRDDVTDRLGGLRGKSALVLSRAHRFYQKARLFPGKTFVVGYDTAVRLVDPAYHGGDRAGVIDDLEQVRDLDCRFLVAGRVVDGTFRSLPDVDVPTGYEDMFTEIPEAAFRWDVSSTEIRQTVRRAAP